MQPDELETWKRALLKFRAQKDELFKHGHDSPFAQAGRGEFGGLRYFEPDPDYRFDTQLHRYGAESTVVMATSRQTRQLFNGAGRFEVVIEGQPVKVQAYQSAGREDRSLFVPFRDATSGIETYGGGRYLDLEVEHDDRYLLDFNYSHSPYCAYNDGYVCPLPPRENWLAVAIRAGERRYH